jgi:glycosyltransferase 2 family protein
MNHVNNAAPGMTTTRKTIHLAKRLFTPAALLAIFYAAWNNREHLTESFNSADPSYLLASILVWIALHAIAPAFSVAALAAFGYKASFSDALYIHNRRLPAKYLPGGIWHTVAKSADYKTHGATGFQIAGYLVTENVMLVAGASLLGCIMLLLSESAPALTMMLALVVAGGLITLTFAPLLLRLYNKEVADNFCTLPYMLSAILILVHWSVAATSFTLYLKAYPDINATLSFAQTAGAYLVSWAVGYIAIFAPQGIGVAEAVSASLLREAGGIGELIVLIATFRAVIFVGDMGAWAGTLIAFRFRKKIST